MNNVPTTIHEPQAEAQATIDDFLNAFVSVACAAIPLIMLPPTAIAPIPPTTNPTAVALTIIAPSTAIAPIPLTTDGSAIAPPTLAPTAIAPTTITRPTDVTCQPPAMRAPHQEKTLF